MMVGTGVQIIGLGLLIAGVCLAISVPAAMIVLGLVMVAAPESRARPR